MQHRCSIQARLTCKLYGLKSAGPVATLRKYTKPAGFGVPWYLCRALHGQHTTRFSVLQRALCWYFGDTCKTHGQQTHVAQHLMVADIGVPSLNRGVTALVHNCEAPLDSPVEQPSVNTARDLVVTCWVSTVMMNFLADTVLLVHVGPQ